MIYECKHKVLFSKVCWCCEQEKSWWQRFVGAVRQITYKAFRETDMKIKKETR